MFARFTFIPAALLSLTALLFTAVPAEAQMKVGVIDIQQVLVSSATGQAAQSEIEGLRTAKKSELEAKQQEILELRKRAEEGALSLAEDKLAELQKEYEDKAIALKRMEDDANRELKKKGEALMGGIERKIMPVIQQIGQEGGYTMIFNKFESGLLFADDAIDISAQVIARLDQGAGS